MRKVIYPYSALAGVSTGIALVAWILLFRERQYPPDEVAVVIAAPMISLLIVLFVTTYLLYGAFAVAVVKALRRQDLLPGKDRPRVTIEVNIAFTAVREGVFDAALPAMATAAAGCSLLAYRAAGIGWALRTATAAVIALSIFTLAAFIYGWIRGLIHRGRLPDADILLRTLRALIRLLTSVGIAKGEA